MLLLLFVCFNTLSAFAGPSRTTYQAKIVKPDGYPLESASVNFKFTILDPVGTCALYSETYSNVSMASSSGLISFSLGTGIKTFPVSGTTFEQVFSNITPFLACDAGGPANYSPGANDIRKIVMQFNDGAGWQTLPAMSINAVPYAMYANDSQTLQGKQASDFVQVSTLPTCGASQAMHYNGSSFSCVVAGGAGGAVTSSTITTALGYTPADGASITAINSSLSTVSSTVGSINSTVNAVSSSVATANSNINSVSSTVSSLTGTVASVSSAVYSVSATVSGLQATVTSLSNSVAASFATIISSQWVTSGSTISYSVGKVGIGTSSPASALEVYSATNPKIATFVGDPTGLNQNVTLQVLNNNASAPAASTLDYSMIAADTMKVSGTTGGIAIIGLGEHYAGGYGNANEGVLTAGTKSSGLYINNRTTTGDIRFGSNAIEHMRIVKTSGYVGIGTSAPTATLDVSGGVRIGVYTTTCSSVNAGTLRYNAGVVEYCNGTSWAAFGVSGAGIMALNGLTSGSQTIAFGTSGTAPNVSSTGTTHTFNFPMAATGSVTAGLISNSDYLSFTNKADSASLTSLTNTAAASYTSLNSNLNSVSSTLTNLSNAAGTSYTTLNSNINAVSSSLNTLANTAAASYTILSANLNTVSATVNNHTASLTALASAVSSVVASQWITSGTSISYNNGNVGIGTASPGYKLAVSGSSYLKGPVMVGNTPIAGNYVDFGPMVGAGTYSAPFVIQETITDFSNNDTFGSLNSTILNAPANTTGLSAGRFSITQNSVSSSANHSTIIGDYLVVDNEGSGNTTLLIGQYPIVVNNSPGNVANAIGTYATAYNVNASSTVSNLAAGWFSAVTLGGSVQNKYGIFIDSSVGAGSVTNNYGLYISDQSIAAASQTYNIYSAGPNANNYFAGVIGVGVFVPQARLHVGAGTSSYAPFKLTSGTLVSSPTSGAIEYDGFNYYITNGANVRRAIATVATPGAYDSVSSVTSTGNITMTPSGSIVVSATTASTSSQTGALIVKGGLGVAGNVNVGGALNVTGIISGSAQVLATGYRATQGVPNNNDSSTNGYSFGADGDTGLFSPGSGGANGVLSLYANNTERLRVDGGGIGIGTSSPRATLQVNQGSSFAPPAATGSAAFSGFRVDGYFGGVALDMGVREDTNPVYSWIQARGNNDYSVNYNIALNPNGGNVGVGTSNPGAKLHVNGNQALENNVVGSGASSIAFWKNRNYGATVTGDELGYISFYGHDGSTTLRSAYIISNGDGTPTTGSVPGNLRFFTTNAGAADSSERMRITASGAVGIGTTTPLAKFTISNNTATPLSTSVGQAHMMHLLGADASSTRLLIDTYSNGTSQTPMLQLRNSQGTAASPSPTVAGDSIGSVRFTGNAATAGSYSGFFGAGIDAYSTATWNTSTGSQPAYLAFSTTGGGANLTERMRIDPAGNIGVGTTVPSEKLDVAGNIKFSGRLIASTTGVSATMIYIRGTGLHNSSNRIVQIGSTTVANDAGRGLTLTILNKSDYSVVSTFNYDTFGNPADSNSMATAMNAIDRTQIGIITSFDSWDAQVTANLLAAFRRLGLMKGYYPTYRQPYAAIFEGASSATVVTAKAVEVTASNNSLAPSAEISGWLVGGTYAVTQSTHDNALYNSTGDTPAVFVNSAGMVGVGGASPTNTLTVSNTQIFNPSANTSAAIMVGPPAGQSFGGGILMKDFTYYGGMWMNGSGAVLTFAAGGTASGFPSTNTLNVTSQAVGVGTAAPTEKLEVAGNLKVTGEIYGQKSWGFKKGPTSNVSDYINAWTAGYHVGTSIDCTSSANGCTILKAGTYEITCVQRGNSTTSTFVGIALNGDRTALESRADAVWDHDHAVAGGQFTTSNFLGTLSAGNFITCGPAAVNSTYMTYGAASYNGTLKIKRID